MKPLPIVDDPPSLFVGRDTTAEPREAKGMYAVVLA
jgi:hypothetical protein